MEKKAMITIRGTQKAQNEEPQTVEFITGLKDIDADWDTYVAGLEKNQVDQYVSIMQAACDAKSGN